MVKCIFQVAVWSLLVYNNLYSQYKTELFNLNGKISGVDDRVIYLSYYDEYAETGRLDSAFIKNGLFYFSGKIKHPTVAFIKLNKKEAIGLNATDIFLEPVKMNITLSLNEFGRAKLTGSKTQDDYNDLRVAGDKIVKNHPLLFDGSGYVYKDLSEQLSAQLSLVYDSLNNINYDYFDKHPTSYLTAYLLQYQARNLSSDSLAIFFNRLDESLKHHPVTQTIRSRIKNIKAGSVGTIAPKFFAKDTSGNEFYSGFIKCKYMLLDFWASWCVPCRLNSPALKEIYNKYKDDGLKIIAIADDRDSIKWREAIQKDETYTWAQVRRDVNPDLKVKGLNDPQDVNGKFNISTLPTYILIDLYGVIIGRFENDGYLIDKLNRKLESLFLKKYEEKN